MGTSPEESTRSRPHGAHVFALLGALVGIWANYRHSVARPRNAMMMPDNSCAFHPSTAAQLGDRVPGHERVPCRPWDIGTGVNGYAWVTPNPRGIVLFQHGWGDYTQRWVHQAAQLIPHLLAAGFSVYGVDMWGNGRSAGKRGVVNVRDAVADNLAARRILEVQQLPIFLMGHSLGGLATATSMLHQKNLAGVVLLAPAVKYDLNVVERLVVTVGGIIAPTLPTPLPEGTMAQLTSITSVSDRLAQDPLMHFGRVPWLTGAGGANISRRNFRRYPSVTVPVLAIHGEADTSTDPDGTRRLIDALSSQDKRFVLLDGVHHLLMDDIRAAQTRDLILDWLTHHSES